MEPTVTELPRRSRLGRALDQAGWRNVAYLAFTLLLIPAALALEAAGPKGPDRGGGIAAGLMLWAVVSLVFFLVNAVLAVVAGARGRPVGPALIACALPPLIVLLVMTAEPLLVR